MEAKGLVFRIQYTERDYHPNVWEERILEEGTPLLAHLKDFEPSIEIGEKRGLFDIHDPKFGAAPAMKNHDFAGDVPKEKHPVRPPVTMAFILPVGEGEIFDSKAQARLLAEARRLTRGFMTTKFPGAELA